MFQDRRHGEFVGIRRQIILCMEELDQLPDTSFERDVVCEDEEAFCLSNDNIAALQLLLGQVRTLLLILFSYVVNTVRRDSLFYVREECLFYIMCFLI